MPGSLFPRSPSVEPEHHNHASSRQQRVRFSSKSPSTRPHKQSTASPSTPPRRSNKGSSVRSAVDKFCVGEDDADPSILLPSPKKSPLAVGTTNYLHPRGADQDLPSPTSRKDKGKARATDSSPVEYFDSSSYLHVKGKERELVAVREELHENERRRENYHRGESSSQGRERESDQARIRMLEEEITRLKEEVCLCFYHDSKYFFSKDVAAKQKAYDEQRKSSDTTVPSTPAATSSAATAEKIDFSCRHFRSKLICISSSLTKTSSYSS